MVMKPEPWGEALDDAAAATRRRCSSCRPRRAAVHPGAGRASSPRERHLVLRVRPLRGHRPAGGRPRRRPGAGRARSPSATTCSTAERSRRWPSSRRSRGCCPGFVGNPESLAEESHGAAGLLEYPVYTKPAVLARARGARRAALRATTGGSPRGGTTSRCAVRPSAGPTCCPPASALERTASTIAPAAGARPTPGAAHPAAGLLGRRGQRGQPGGGCPPLHEDLDDVSRGGPSGRRVVLRCARTPVVGSVRAPRVGGRRTGGSAGSWWRPTFRAGGSVGGCWQRARRWRPTDVARLRLVTGARSERATCASTAGPATGTRGRAPRRASSRLTQAAGR